jgi:lipid-A-disaccharide synthase
MRIGIVAGEASGDLLGSELIIALKHYYPDAEFIGVAGSKMLNAGAKTLFELDKLSVMGFSEVLVRLKELITLRRMVKDFFLQQPPDVYIGIDSPDFNLPIETALKKAGIKTVHCNSPTIWAWRKKRMIKIKHAVDLMLTLFPFEAKYYEEQHVPVKYIGHPLADVIPLETNTLLAKKQLQLPHKNIIALLPGSRRGEIKHNGPVLLKAAKLYMNHHPGSVFISPMINRARCLQFEQQWKSYCPELPLRLYDGKSHEVMAAADIIVLTSGTATLEAMLFKKPMVVIYRASWFSAWMAKQLVKIKYFSLPNILANAALVPEFFQDQATPENIFTALINYEQDSEKINQLKHQFDALHLQLRCHASEKAALAIRELLL